MFLYESGDNIRYYYEVYLDSSDKREFENIEIRLVIRNIVFGKDDKGKEKIASEIIFHIDKDKILEILDNKISKIAEKVFQGYVDYKGEADPERLKDNNGN